METFTFTLILSGAAEPTDEMQGALIRAGCDDALFGSRAGVLFLDFDREASSLLDAVSSAIRDVEGAGVGLRVDRVEPDELVTTTDIARRLDRSRELIRLYATGQRGPGGFPAPVSRLKNRTTLYRWSDVAGWMTEQAPTPSGAASSGAFWGRDATIGYINAALDLRRLGPAVPDVTSIKTLLDHVLSREPVPGTPQARKPKASR